MRNCSPMVSVSIAGLGLGLVLLSKSNREGGRTASDMLQGGNKRSEMTSSIIGRASVS